MAGEKHHTDTDTTFKYATNLEVQLKVLAPALTQCANYSLFSDLRNINHA